MRDRKIVLRVFADLVKADREGLAGLNRRQDERLAALVAHARVYSPYFRELYSGVDFGPVTLTSLPVTRKLELMDRFDDWVADTRISFADVEAFLADPTLSGVRFLDEYFVCRSSGTSGHPGVFIADRGSLSVIYATHGLSGFRMWPRARRGRLVTKGLRRARVVGTGGHFAAASLVEFEHRDNPATRRREQVVSVEEPLADVVAQLNSFDPALLQGYPSVVRQLADEQRAGRLRIYPGLIGTGGETVSIEERRQMASVFGAPVVDAYGASECLLAAITCRQEWFHYRSDWMILEPVDADYLPVPPGEPSATVLLTNLTNRVQPIIRYDLGDSIVLRPDPCECGSPLPALRVTGRQDDVLKMESRGEVVEVLPLAITAGLDQVEGLGRFQILQTGPRKLSIRIACDDPEQRPAVWRSVSRSLVEFLDRQGIEDPIVELADQPPSGLGASGKFHQVIGLPLSKDHDEGALGIRS